MSELRLKFDEFDVSAIVEEATSSIATLVFAHGAGAGYRHQTLEEISARCLEKDISILRFNFPYMEAGKNRTDRQEVATQSIAAALDFAKRELAGPYFLGGHSFGGRMASHAVVDHSLDVGGLIFCSFPLHNPKKPNIDRAAHLDDVSCPMLFLSGTRDGMASKDLMGEVVQRVNAKLHWLDTADHGYKVLKRTRLHPDDVFTEMTDQVHSFISDLNE